MEKWFTKWKILWKSNLMYENWWFIPMVNNKCMSGYSIRTCMYFTHVSNKNYLNLFIICIESHRKLLSTNVTNVSLAFSTFWTFLPSKLKWIALDRWEAHAILYNINTSSGTSSKCSYQISRVSMISFMKSLAQPNAALFKSSLRFAFYMNFVWIIEDTRIC